MHALLFLFLFAGCDGGEEAVSTTPNSASEPLAIYTCPMHPEVTQDSEGKCPKCGMKLDKREAPPPGAPPAVPASEGAAPAGGSGG